MSETTEKPLENHIDETELDASIALARDAARVLLAVVEGMEMLDAGDAARIHDAAPYYWRVATHSWSPERHGRVYLLEAVRNPSLAAGLKLDQLPASVRAGNEALRAVFASDCPESAQVEEAERHAWFAFWLFYPEHARRLNAAKIARVARLLRGEEANKWIELAEICHSIGFQRVHQDTLSSEDRAWRRLKRKR